MTKDEPTWTATPPTVLYLCGTGIPLDCYEDAEWSGPLKPPAKGEA